MKNFKLNLFFFVLVTISLVCSCDKSHHNIVNEAEKPEWTLSIPYPTSNSIQELFQKNKLLIASIVNNNDEKEAETYVKNLADEIAGYYYWRK